PIVRLDLLGDLRAEPDLVGGLICADGGGTAKESADRDPDEGNAHPANRSRGAVRSAHRSILIILSPDRDPPRLTSRVHSGERLISTAPPGRSGSPRAGSRPRETASPPWACPGVPTARRRQRPPDRSQERAPAGFHRSASCGAPATRRLEPGAEASRAPGSGGPRSQVP